MEIENIFNTLNRKQKRSIRSITRKNQIKNFIRFLKSDEAIKEFAEALPRASKNHIENSIPIDLRYLDKDSKPFYFYIAGKRFLSKKVGQASNPISRFDGYKSSNKSEKIDQEDAEYSVSMPITIIVPESIVHNKSSLTSEAYNESNFNPDFKYDQFDIIPYILSENVEASKTRDEFRTIDVSVESITGVSCFDIISAVINFYTGDPIVKSFKRSLSYIPYVYQNEAVNKISNILNERDIAHLVSPTRSGKSTIISGIIKKNGYKTTLIITPYPNGYSSFNKIINKHKDYEGYEIVQYGNGIFEAFNSETKNKVYFVSWAALKNDSSKALDIIKEINSELIVLDEFHRESDSEKSINLINNIKLMGTKILNVSATPYDEILKGLITDGNSCIITRDAIKKYRRENKKPDYHQFIFMMELAEVFSSYLKEGEWTEKEMPTPAKMMQMINSSGKEVNSFKDEDLTAEELDNWKFKYENALINTIIHFLSIEKIGNSKKYGLAGNQSLLDSHNKKNNSNALMKDIFENILLLVPSMASAYVLHKLFQNNDRLSNLGIVTHCSVSNSSLRSEFKDEKGDKFHFFENEDESRETKVDAWMKNHNDGGSRTMIITSMSHTTAETLSYLSCVVMLRDMNSHELFMQTMGRPNNTGDREIRYTGLVVPKGVFLKKIAKAYITHTELYPNDDVDIQKIIMNWYDCAESMFYLNGDKWESFSEEEALKEISLESIRLKNDLEKDIDIFKDLDNIKDMHDLFIELGKNNPEMSIESTFSMNDNLGKNGERISSKLEKSSNKTTKSFNNYELMIIGYKNFVEDIKQVVHYAYNINEIDNLNHYSDIYNLEQSVEYSFIADNKGKETYINIIKYFFENMSDSNRSVWNRYLNTL